MNWTEQVELMMKTWNEAQRQLLGGWSGLGGGDMPGIPGMPGMPNPMSWFTSGLPAWAKGGESATGQNAAQNLFSSQAMMMQSLGALTQAWQVITPSLAAGKPWQPDFDNFLKQWRDEILGVPHRVSTATSGIGELTKSFMAEWGPLLGPWLASIQGTGLGGPLGDILGGEKSPLGKILGSRMEPAFKDLAQIPMIGVGREQIAKIMHAFDVHVDVRKASLQYQGAMAKAIGEAMKETMEQLVALSKKGEKIDGVRDLIRIWVKTADRKFTQMYVNEDFVEIQREVSRANLQNKLAKRAVFEMIFNQLEIPTRTELDDAYKTLHGLKKEVRELRNARKQSESESAALLDAHRKTASEFTKLHSTFRKLESDIALLRDAHEKMEAGGSDGKPAAAKPDLRPKTGAAAPARADAPIKVTRKKVPSQKSTTQGDE